MCKSLRNRRKIIIAAESYSHALHHYVTVQWQIWSVYNIQADFSADLEFALVGKKLFQVELDLGQSQGKATVREQIVTGFCFGSSSDGTAHCQGEGPYSSLQAGDVNLDLAEKPCERGLQLIIQKPEVMADTGQSLNGRSAEFYLWGCRQLRRRRRRRREEDHPTFFLKHPSLIWSKQTLSIVHTCFFSFLMWTRVILAIFIILFIVFRMEPPFVGRLEQSGATTRERQRRAKRMCILNRKIIKK